MIGSDCLSYAQPADHDQMIKNFASPDTIANQDRSYFLVKLKSGIEKSLIALPDGAVVRSLSDHHFIVSAGEQNDNKFEYVLPAGNTWKLSPELLDFYNKKMLFEGAVHSFSLVVTDPYAFNKYIELQKGKVTITHNFNNSKIIMVSLKDKQAFEQVLALKTVIHIASRDKVPSEEQAIYSHDLTANKVNYLHGKAPGLNGKALTLSVKENKPDTGDIDFKGRFINSPQSSKIISNHATVMCTIAAGAGNSYSSGKGVAWGSRIGSSDFALLLPDHDSDYTTYQVSVQNHSYGTGIENYYGHDAMAYDISTNNNPALLHVFSAGNSGNLTGITGTYTGVEHFANITGSFKMAKNSITVGAVDSVGNVAAVSSRGPAHDGRLKPELVAFGQDGSSGAAAIVSGISLLLQQAYREKSGGLFPNSALLKAVLINSADDVASKGIDFTSGYGNVNAYKAFNSLLEGRYISGTVQQGVNTYFDINVPANVKNLKVTIAWNDPASTANAFTALVNDLDMQVLHKATQTNWEPWVLNSAAHADSLKLLPVRKKDHINNIELITIEDPVAGNYQIQVNGTRVVGQQQAFFIVYQWDTLNTFKWMHPAHNDNLFAGNNTLLRWESGFADTGRIEYSLDAGTNWKLLDAATDLSRNYLKWVVPDTFCTALLRMTVRGAIFTSDTFAISKPVTPNVGYNCPDSLLLFWNTNFNVARYQLYQMGDQYLEAVSSWSDTMAVLGKPAPSTFFYAVSPLLPDGRSGIRSYTFNYTTQGVGCYIKSFLADPVNSTTSRITLDLGTRFRVRTIDIEKLAGNSSQIVKRVEPVRELRYTFPDILMTKGLNRYRVKITLNNEKVIYSDIETAWHVAKDEFIIFPNPVRQNQVINILSDNANNNIFQIFSADGKKLLEKSISDSIDQVHLSGLNKGIYMFTIQKKQTKMVSGKLIIN